MQLDPVYASQSKALKARNRRLADGFESLTARDRAEAMRGELWQAKTAAKVGRRLHGMLADAVMQDSLCCCTDLPGGRRNLLFQRVRIHLVGGAERGSRHCASMLCCLGLGYHISTTTLCTAAKVKPICRCWPADHLALQQQLL